MSLQLGPDAFPGRAAQQSAIEFAARDALQLKSFRRIHVPAPGKALIQVRFADSGQAGKTNPLLAFERAGDDFSIAHTPHRSDSLQAAQGVRSGFRAIRYVKMDSLGNSNPLDNGGMETAGERRRRKLAALCEQYGRDRVAQMSGMNPFALEQVVKGVLLPAKKDGTRSPRNLGDAAARAIEAAFGLGEGWFDAPDEMEALSQEAINLARAYEKMTAQERVRLGHLIAASLDIDIDELTHKDGGGISGLAPLDDDEQDAQ